MNLDQELRSVLHQESERHEPPLPDVGALWTTGRARRRRRLVIGSATGAAVAVVVSSVLAVGVSQRLSLGGGDPVGRPSPSDSVRLAPGAPPAITYCSTATKDSPQEILHVDGRDLAIDCVYRNFPEPGHHTYLWQHAGRTIITSLTGVHVVTRDGADRISGMQHPEITISFDGRYVAWLTAWGQPAYGDVRLTVYDLAEGHMVVTAPPPAEATATWQTVDAIDALGRAFVVTADEEFWMYDIAGGPWTQVRGLPEDFIRPDGYALSYPTEDGLAVLVEEPSIYEQVGRSVEGHVTQDGEFVPAREVPIGVASWSPDRSLFLHLTADGFWVQPADDVDAKVVLGVPLPEDNPLNVMFWDAQWESAATVLLTVIGRLPDGTGDSEGTTVVRCHVDSGACERLTGIVVPLSNQAHPLG